MPGGVGAAGARVVLQRDGRVELLGEELVGRRSQLLGLQCRMAQDGAVHRAVRTGRSLPGDGDVAQLGADHHPVRRYGEPGLRGLPATPADEVGQGTQRRLHLQLEDLERRAAGRRAPLVLQPLREDEQVRPQGGGGARVGVRAEVHAGDVHARLGVDDQVIRRDRRGDAAAVLQVVALGAGPEQPREPVPGVLLRRHVQRRLVGEHVLVPRGVEGDDEQVVVQRDVEQLEELGEHVLVLVQHGQCDGAVPRALTGHDPLHPRSRRFCRRTVAFGHQDVDRVLQQPLRLGHAVQQQVQLGVRRRAGQAVQDPVQQAEEAGGEQPAALVLREPRQAGAGGVPDDDRRGAAAGDAGDRDPDPVPAGRRPRAGSRCAGPGTAPSPAAAPRPASRG